MIKKHKYIDYAFLNSTSIFYFVQSNWTLKILVYQVSESMNSYRPQAPPPPPPSKLFPYILY